MTFREKLAIQILFVIVRLLAPESWRGDIGGVAAEFHLATRREAL
jgi:hypothetical protein